MTFITTVFTAMVITVFSAALALPAAQDAAVKPQRFDYLVRADFFAGAAGDEARLQRVIEICERTLEQHPQHPEAMVWRGAVAIVRSRQAFQNGEAAAGQQQFARGLKEMTDAVTLAPNSPGVLIPRGAVLFEATRGMPAEMARPLVQSAIANYERALEVQAPTFATLGDHAKGELLFGLADGWARVGDPQKARQYFERLIADAPSSGQTAKAREFMATGVVPASNGSSCVGCHK